MTLLSGVGPGALREHYRARWFKGFGTEVTDANILDGDDFSLQMGSLQLSDSGTYYSDVEVCDLPESPCMNSRCLSEQKTHISLTVYGENQQGISGRMINRGSNLYLTLIVTVVILTNNFSFSQLAPPLKGVQSQLWSVK